MRFQYCKTGGIFALVTIVSIFSFALQAQARPVLVEKVEAVTVCTISEEDILFLPRTDNCLKLKTLSDLPATQTGSGIICWKGRRPHFVQDNNCEKFDNQITDLSYVKMCTALGSYYYFVLAKASCLPPEPVKRYTVGTYP